MDSEIRDIAPLCEAKSDQLNADDLVGPQVFTVARITRGKAQKKGEQPMWVHLVEFARGPWKPCKGMLRVLGEAFGRDPSQWPAGLRVELFRATEHVQWAGEPTGGIRICGLSHIQGDFVALVTEGRGRKAHYPIRRLPDAAPRQQAPTADLDRVLVDLGITVADLDTYRASLTPPRGPIADATPEQRAAMAAWLGNPDNAAKVPRSNQENQP